MKTLLLIRHAKSSWDNFSQPDFERPLNDRGKRDAVAMAERLISQKISIDLFISSTAKRAVSTARRFAKAYKVDKSQILLKDELYLASPHVFSNVITSLNNERNSVALFSHNPGITAYANSLSVATVDDMPTCSIFAVTTATDNWKCFAEVEKEFLFFDYPGKLSF